MSSLNKVIYIGFIVILILCGVYIIAEHGKKTKLLNENASLSRQIADLEYTIRSADAAIDRQNAAIEAVRVDTVVVERQVNNIARRYTETREVIVEKIKKDSSSENKLFIIDSVLRCYHGVRSENSYQN